MTEGITLLTWKVIIKNWLKISFLKPSKILKTLTILKVVKNNQNFVKKRFLLLKYPKLLTFIGQKIQQKNCHVFLGAFIWNHPWGKVVRKNI